MSRLLLLVKVFAVFIASFVVSPVEAKTLNEIRTYMPFSFPIDPAKIHSLPDLNIAFALNSTLIERDNEKEISAGLVDRWVVISPRVYRLTLKHNAKWSNGALILATDVKKSIERTLRVHPSDVRGIVQVLDSISCPSNRDIDFKLNLPAHDSNILQKLTDPKFGIVKVLDNGKLDMSTTSGLFSVLPNSNQEQLVLVKNPNSLSQLDPSLADRIIIRKMPVDKESPTVLRVDDWPNLIESTSLHKENFMKKYQRDGFETWATPLDKLLYLQLGKRSANAEGRGLIRFLRSKIKNDLLVQGLSGYTPTNQVFPRGYELYASGFSCVDRDQEALPERFKSRPIDILISPARVSSTMKDNLGQAVKEATGKEPRFISVPLEQAFDYRSKGDFDLYFGTIGLTEPDPEAMLSFNMESDIPLIFTAGTQLLQRLDHAKSVTNYRSKVQELRNLLRDIQCDGHLLPFFHFSTIGLARSELDFSQMSKSDESIRFEKIRFKKSIADREISQGIL